MLLRLYTTFKCCQIFYVASVSQYNNHFSYRSKRAVDVGEISLLIYAKPTMGKKYVCVGNKVSLEHQWAQLAIPFAFQTIVEVDDCQSLTLTLTIHFTEIIFFQEIERR